MSNPDGPRTFFLPHPICCRAPQPDVSSVIPDVPMNSNRSSSSMSIVQSALQLLSLEPEHDQESLDLGLPWDALAASSPRMEKSLTHAQRLLRLLDTSSAPQPCRAFQEAFQGRNPKGRSRVVAVARKSDSASRFSLFIFLSVSALPSLILSYQRYSNNQCTAIPSPKGPKSLLFPGAVADPALPEEVAQLPVPPTQESAGVDEAAKPGLYRGSVLGAEAQHLYLLLTKACGSFAFVSIP